MSLKFASGHGLGSGTAKVAAAHKRQKLAERISVKQAKGVFDAYRVAGNVYECPSTKDFWKVEASGAIVKLTSTPIVDNNETLPSAGDSNPEAFLASIFADLEY